MRRTILTVLLAFVCAFSSFSWAFEARVVGIIDGDTIDVLDLNKVQHRVRFAGIDAPEHNQDFGKRAKENLSNLVFGKTVSVPGSKKNSYERLVSRILIGDRDIGLEQIKAGMAWHAKKFEFEQSPADRSLYSTAEIQARSAKIGLWSQANPVLPEDFRYKMKEPKAAGSGAECPCGTNNFCTGPRGGQFCMDGGGKKKYAAH